MVRANKICGVYINDRFITSCTHVEFIAILLIGMIVMRKLIALLSISILSGCAQQPLVTVNALSSGQSVGKRFIILPASQALYDANQIEYNQIAAVVSASLTRQGYIQVNEPEKADQGILLGFARSGAVTSTRNVTVPIYGQTGISSATTYGNANTTYNYLGGGNLTSNTTGSATTVYTPTYGITGAYDTTVTNTSYGTAVALNAYDAKVYLKSNRVNLLWKSSAALVSSRADSIADYRGLASIAANYANMNTNGDTHLRIDPRNPTQ